MHVSLADRFGTSSYEQHAIPTMDADPSVASGRRYAPVSDTTSAVSDTERQAEAARAMMVADLASAWQSPAVLPRRSEPRTLASAPAATQVPASDEAAAQQAHVDMVASLSTAWRTPGHR